MPTGYTADIADGKHASARKFLHDYAHEFGFMSYRRGEGVSDLPDEIPFDGDYYARSLADATTRLDELLAMTQEDIERRCDEYNTEQIAMWRERTEKDKQMRARYDAVISAVEEWDEPSILSEFRTKAIEHLKESRNFDCHTWKMPQKLTPEKWFDQQFRSAERDVDYNAENYRKARERHREANIMLQALRDSTEGMA